MIRTGGVDQAPRFLFQRIVNQTEIDYTVADSSFSVQSIYLLIKTRVACDNALGSSPMHQKTVLIVDDELSILVPLQFLMEKEGYVPKLAQSGKEAIEQIAKVRPDLILLDIMLPDLDGYEIYQMIRQRIEWESIRVIFLTAKNRDADMAKGIAMGADAYITKPFSNAQLIEKIRQLIGPGKP